MFVILTILLFFLFFNDTATTEIYTLSLHDALPISPPTLPALRASSGTTRRSRQRWRAPEERHRARTECLERGDRARNRLAGRQQGMRQRRARPAASCKIHDRTSHEDTKTRNLWRSMRFVVS